MKPVAIIPCLTSHHTIHSICFCSHPWCKWRHWAIPAFSLSAAGGRHLQKGHELCLCLWFHSASSTALFHLRTEDITHLQAKHILKCTVMIWFQSLCGTQTKPIMRREKPTYTLQKLKHICNFPFQQTIGIEHRSMIWFWLDKCASPSTEKPLTVLQLDKSEVYLRNPKGKFQTYQVSSVLEVADKSPSTF